MHLATRYPQKAHDHDVLEVLWVVKGRTAHLVNGATHRLEPGQLVFMRPADTHAFRADRAKGCEIINIMFRENGAEHHVNRYSDTLASRFFASKAEVIELHTLGAMRFNRPLIVSS